MCTYKWKPRRREWRRSEKSFFGLRVTFGTRVYRRTVNRVRVMSAKSAIDLFRTSNRAHRALRNDIIWSRDTICYRGVGVGFFPSFAGSRSSPPGQLTDAKRVRKRAHTYGIWLPFSVCTRHIRLAWERTNNNNNCIGADFIRFSGPTSASFPWSVSPVSVVYVTARIIRLATRVCVCVCGSTVVYRYGNRAEGEETKQKKNVYINRMHAVYTMHGERNPQVAS